MLAPIIWIETDADQNKTVTPAEAQAWLEPYLAEFSLEIDGTPLTWQVDAVTWPASSNDFLAGGEMIDVTLSADWPANLTSQHQLTLHNHHQEVVSVNRFYLQAVDGITFQTPQQQHARLQIDFEIDPANTTQNGSQTWDSGVPSISPLMDTLNLNAITAETETSQVEGDNSPSSILTGLVRSTNFSPTIYLVGLMVALLLGALHALTPGHGKTVVAAYLVGSRGTAWHAINLGAIVTVTHTGSVFLLGLITLFASQYILPTRLLPMLEIVSGLLIVGFGIYLFYLRWPAWQNGSPADHHHHHHDHHHHHHHHDHDHHGHGHHHHMPDKVTWRSLLTLGVSGGLVPCPDAIAILLVAIAINRIAFGLSLIVAFSLGLALVLTVIGLAMVHSHRLFEKVDAFSRFAPLMPLASAIIVLALGLWLTISAISHTEVIATTSPTPANEQQIVTKPPLDFQIDQASLIYLAPDEQRVHQLYRIDLTGGEPVALSQEVVGVWGYALSPDGQTVAYMASQNYGRTDIWFITPNEQNQPEQLPCPEKSCSGPVWSPDGGRLIFETLSPPSLEDLSSQPSLWWLDMATGEMGQVLQNNTWSGYNAGWSPDGQWLSYIYPNSAEVEIYNLVDGRRHTLPNPTGLPAIWSPVDEQLLVMDFTEPASHPPIIHLFRFDLEDETLLDLSEQTMLSTTQAFMDTAAAWSPDGEWVVVVRREIGESGATLGSKLWLMRADGTQARKLTTEPNIIHGNPAWSPDGEYLVFHRYSLQKQNAQPEIWTMNIRTNELREIATPGRMPTWIP